MSSTMKGVNKGKGKGKRNVQRNPDSDSIGEVIYDRVLIYDIGVKISKTEEYSPIREVRI